MDDAKFKAGIFVGPQIGTHEQQVIRWQSSQERTYCLIVSKEGTLTILKQS